MACCGRHAQLATVLDFLDQAGDPETLVVVDELISALNDVLNMVGPPPGWTPPPTDRKD